jgi:hypothetical protein
VADVDFQNLSTVQSNLQPKPVTMAAATTIAPSTFLTLITGTTAVNNITPPVTGTHLLALIFTATNPGAFGTTGNIDVTGITTPGTANRVTFLVYNPNSAKYIAMT